MNHSDEINEVGPAWANCLHAVSNVTKDASGHHGSYASLTAVLDAVKPVLADNSLAVQQYNRPGNDGRVIVVTRIWHTSGQWIEDEGLAMAVPTDPQKVGSAVTYARRYSLTTFFGIATADDDGQSATDHIRNPPKTENEKLYDDLAALRGTPAAEKLKSWAAGRDEVPDQPFTVSTFDAEPEWAEQVRAQVRAVTS